MDDLQATLQSLLDDPEELGKLAQTAASLFQNEDQEKNPEMPDLNRIMQMLRGANHSESQKLIGALAPFLSDDRRARLERASRIAHLSSIAELALGREEELG